MNPALLKPPLFVAGLLPLAGYSYGLFADALGANPIEAVTRGLGTWALNFLLLTLAVTPARKYLGWTWSVPLRRMLGLYAFFYALLHLTTYLWFDQSFDWYEIGRDMLKRPFIAAGMLTFALLVPLAATSNARAVRRLGGRAWQRLHRLVYVAALLAMLHFAWMVKADILRPATYGLVLVALLLARAGTLRSRLVSAAGSGGTIPNPAPAGWQALRFHRRPPPDFRTPRPAASPRDATRH